MLTEKLVNEEKSIPQEAISGWEAFQMGHYSKILKNTGKYYGFEFNPDQAIKDYRDFERDLLLYGTESQQFRRHFPNKKPPSTNAQGRFEGVVTNLVRRYNEHAENNAYREKLDQYFVTQTCTDCEGTRLRAESRRVCVAGRSIVELSHIPLVELDIWLKTLPDLFTEEEMLIARPVLDDLSERIGRLLEVGAGYLTLDRDSPSLSAGESQRLKLALCWAPS